MQDPGLSGRLESHRICVFKIHAGRMMGVYVSHDGARDDVFKCLSCYRCKRDRPVVLCFTTVFLLVDWYHIGTFHVVRNDSLVQRSLEEQNEDCCELSSCFLTPSCW